MQQSEPAFSVRVFETADMDQIEAFYPLAFPDEDLLPLVRELTSHLDDVLILVATAGRKVIGHGVFTLCGLDGGAPTLALLGPLAVTPDWQRRGVGSAVIKAGIDRLKAMDVAGVCVLGDPAYYSRFGFSADHQIAAPYTMPDEWAEAWRYLDLTEDAMSPSGTLTVPTPWAKKALWLP